MKSRWLLKNKIDYLLIIGTILAPMTGLRVWKIGPGEVICLLYCINNYKSFRYLSKRDIFIRFWIGFLLCSSIGALWGTIKYPSETSGQDLIIWVYLAIISTGVHLVIKEKTKEEIAKIVSYISYGAAIWYYFLFQYSRRVSRYFFGARLWYGRVRFSGGGTNPHQVALLLCFAATVLVWKVLNHKSFRSRIANIILFYLAFFLLEQTRSSTAIMAVSIGMICVVWQFVWVNYKDKKTLFVTVFVIATIAIILFGVRGYHAFIDWVLSDVNGSDRLELFASFPIAFLKGPVFGLGPGIHARGGSMEFHNSYLEITAMSGLLGMLFFTAFSFRLFRQTLTNPISFGSLIAVYAFGMSGFGARRLVYWMVVALTYQFANTDYSRSIKRRRARIENE